MALILSVCNIATAKPAAIGVRQAKPAEHETVPAPVTAEQGARIAAIFARIKDDGLGAAVCVCRNGHLIYESGCGCANIEKQSRITPQSVFDLAAGMTHTMLLTEPGQKVPHRVGGYTKRRGEICWTRMDTHIVGDGQVMTSVEDLAAWEKALRTSKILSKGWQDLAFTRTTLNNGQKTDYGMGWEIDHDLVYHSGGWNGTATYVRRDLGNGLTVIVLSNNEKFDSKDAGDKVAEIFD